MFFENLLKNTENPPYKTEFHALLLTKVHFFGILINNNIEQNAMVSEIRIFALIFVCGKEMESRYTKLSLRDESLLLMIQNRMEIL